MSRMYRGAVLDDAEYERVKAIEEAQLIEVIDTFEGTTEPIEDVDPEHDDFFSGAAVEEEKALLDETHSSEVVITPEIDAQTEAPPIKRGPGRPRKVV